MTLEGSRSTHTGFKEHTDTSNVQHISFGTPPNTNSFEEFDAVDLNWAKPSERDISPYGERSYAISSIIRNEHVKSSSFDTCFGIVMTGRDAEGQGVVRLVHAYPTFIFSDTEYTERFTRDLLHATREFNAACKKGSVDVSITCGWNPANSIHNRTGKRFGGEERRRREHARHDYEKMIHLFQKNFDGELAFSPTMIVGKHHVPGNVRLYATAASHTPPHVYIEDARLQDMAPISAVKYATCKLSDATRVLKTL